MSDNTNIVKQWAQNMLDDATKAINRIGTDNKAAIGFVSEIKGACEAIVATMVGMEDHRCPTCKYYSASVNSYPCNSCRYGTRGSINDQWENA